MENTASGIQRSFTDLALETLSWQQAGFTGETFDKNELLGKEEIRVSFKPRPGFEDSPAVMVRIIDFLASGMGLDGDHPLAGALTELREGSALIPIPSEEKSSPVDRLKEILWGRYDVVITKSRLAGLGKVYTLTLFYYLHLTSDSREDMAPLMARMIREFDDPESSRYEYDIDGMRAHPFLARLCALTIERYDILPLLSEELRDLPDNCQASRSLEEVRRKLNAASA